MHLLKIVYVPAIRRFQRYKAIDAKTVTARTGPAMTYHCTPGAAERNKRILAYYGSTKNDGPRQNEIVPCWLRFSCIQDFCG